MVAHIEVVPLAQDVHGVYRVGKSRVTLDLVIRAFNRGKTAEEIVSSFPSLELPDVYQVVGYYLKHSAEFAEYFERRGREERELLAAHPEWQPKGLRERLMARAKEALNGWPMRTSTMMFSEECVGDFLRCAVKSDWDAGVIYLPL